VLSYKAHSLEHPIGLARKQVPRWSDCLLPDPASKLQNRRHHRLNCQLEERLAIMKLHLPAVIERQEDEVPGEIFRAKDISVGTDTYGREIVDPSPSCLARN
jgi:hypothetical protein